MTRINRFRSQELKVFLTWTVQGALLVDVFQRRFFSVEPTHGPSMLPTLNVFGDYVVSDHIAPRTSDLHFGDVAVYKSPMNPARFVCKRIVGLPGDKVCIDPLSEERGHIVVPKGHYWLQGDNLPESRDSRDYGPVPSGLVVGVLRAKLWPIPKQL